jgi:hypothetical protein
VVVSVFDGSLIVGVDSRPFFKRNKSIKFGIIGKLDGSVNPPGIGGGGGKGGAPITSKLTDEELFV